MKHKLRLAANRTAGGNSPANRITNEIAQRLLERLDLIRLRPKMLVELGCANGQWLLDLAERYPGAQLFGIDHAVARLQKVDSKFMRVAADFEQLPFLENSMDAVVSNLSFHRADWPILCGQVYRVLADNGFFIFSTLGVDSFRELRWALQETRGDASVLPFEDLHTIGDLLLTNGFSEVVTDAERLTILYPDVQTLFVDLKELGERDSLIYPVFKGRHYFEKVTEALESLREQGGIPITLEVIYGHAWRLPKPISSNDPNEVRIPLSAIRRR